VRTFDASNASSASASCAVDGFSFQLPAMSARRCGCASYQTLLLRRVDGARTVVRGATNAWLDASASAAASICMMPPSVLQLSAVVECSNARCPREISLFLHSCKSLFLLLSASHNA
jgi:hypothetical protein